MKEFIKDWFKTIKIASIAKKYFPDKMLGEISDDEWESIYNNEKSKKVYNYYDSIAGHQTQTFDKLSECIKYIEDFGHEGDESSIGIIYANSEPIFEYRSSKDGLTWEYYGL